MDWTKILYLIGAVLIGMMLYRRIRSNPAAFSGANINKTVQTLGLLALVLIGFIWVMVLLLRM